MATSEKNHDTVYWTDQMVLNR